MIGNDDYAKDSGVLECCYSYTKCCFWFFNVLTLCCYPFAVCFKECVRFYGFIIYYFGVVPARYISIFICQPCLDAQWRCARPFFTACVLFVKPVVAIMAECCIACHPWLAICNKGSVEFKADFDNKEMS